MNHSTAMIAERLYGSLMLTIKHKKISSSTEPILAAINCHVSCMYLSNTISNIVSNIYL
ncbi:hypothetical protein ACFPZK_06715 [Psychrobacter urativorans]|uniref:hypothetical protein n=1 Tax=Psychrobacter urativorans TaxID=45610 RepID=UPI00361AE067